MWAEDGTRVSAFFLPRHDIFSDSLIPLFENFSEEASYVLSPPLLKISSPLSSIPPIVFVPQILIYWSHLEFTIIFRGTGSRYLFFGFPRRKSGSLNEMLMRFFQSVSLISLQVGVELIFGQAWASNRLALNNGNYLIES